MSLPAMNGNGELTLPLIRRMITKEMSAKLPSEEELIGEESQLKRCRWALLLLGTGILLQLGIILFPIVTAEIPKDQEPVQIATRELRRIIESCELSILAHCLTFLPGAILLIINARSDRWRKHAFFLLAAVVVDIGLMIAIYVLLTRALGSTTLPRPAYILLEIESLMIWPILWFLAVLVAEFAMASRASILVSQTERLGNAILVGSCLGVAYVGWTLPSYPVDFGVANLDEGTALLGLAAALATFVCMFWTMRELAAAATLARMLGERSRQARRSSPNEEKPS
jgi:hypothetical protein